ncbi:MAG: MoaD/ThiS family protein [Chloroflexota bacterium]
MAEWKPVTVIQRGKELQVKPGMSVKHALEKIAVLPETVIVTRRGELITEDELLEPGDVIKLVSVISGG